MSKSMVSDEPISGMCAMQCHICGKHINTINLSQINKSVAAHLRAHVQKGEAVRKTAWNNSRGRRCKTIVVYEKIKQ